MSCGKVRDFLKIDFALVFTNSIVLSAASLLLIPVIRGVSNLNSIQSAQCLSQSVSLTGVLLIVPIIRPETEAPVKETICTKPWPYLKTVLIRIVCSLALNVFFILSFACIMKLQNCTFSFWSFSGVTILYAAFMGMLGLVVSGLGNNVIIGYLAAAGYWSLGQLQIIQAGTPLDLFPVFDGMICIRKVFILLAIDIFLIFGFFLLIQKSNPRK